MKNLNTYKQFLNEKVSDEEVFAYLDSLRQSGQTNMFGAGAYIERDFNLDKRKARDLLTKWMKSFDESVNEARNEEKLKIEDVIYMWDKHYGEDFSKEFKKAYQILKRKGTFTRSEMSDIWSKIYDESLEDKYNGFYNEF